MAARVSYAGRDYQLADGESVLDGLTRQGAALAAACRAGVCQTCLVRASHGDPGQAARQGLTPTLAAGGYFLACLARPAGDLRIGPPGPDVITPVTLADRRWLSPDVIAVWLRAGRPVSFRPGQHVTLHRDGGVARPYSIANLPAEAGRDGMAFHVRVYSRGAMSRWLASAAPGTRLGLGVPTGDCSYVPGAPASPLLLAGTGTGIAPLVAIARDALRQGHTGPVVMVHGAADQSRLYLGERPSASAGAPAWAHRVRWLACLASRGEDMADMVTSEFRRLGEPTAARAFLCGGRRGVLTMRRALFLAGMSVRHIRADAFVPATS